MSKDETSKKEKIEGLRLYADSGCTRQIEDISWNNSEKVAIVEKDGTVKTVDFVQERENATAEVWIKNPSPFDFTVRQIKCSNSAIQLFLNEAQIFPQRPVKLTLKAKGRTVTEPIILVKGYYTVPKVIEK